MITITVRVEVQPSMTLLKVWEMWGHAFDNSRWLFFCSEKNLVQPKHSQNISKIKKNIICLLKMTYTDRNITMTVMIIQNMFLLYFVYAAIKLTSRPLWINVSTPSSRVYTKSIYVYHVAKKWKWVIKIYLPKAPTKHKWILSGLSILYLSISTKSYGGIVHKSHMINYNRS